MSRQKYTITVVCDDPGVFHERHGRSVLANYVDAVAGKWFEPVPKSIRSEDERRELHRHAAEGTPTPLHDSAKGKAGQRPRTLSHLVDDTVVDLEEQVRLVKEGGRSIMQERRLEGSPGHLRQHLEWRCKCGLAKRARAEDVWPVFDRLRDAGVEEISLRHLIRLAGRV